MSEQKNIYLIGPMGAGKTSVAKWLARKGKLKYYDTDHEIEERTGVSISWIFEVEQETGFRQREENVIRELTKLDRVVLSTGGGCIVTPNNRKHLSKTGIVIYLKVSLAEQLKRTRRYTGKRPLIEVNDRKQRLIELNKQREPLYMEVADLIYETDYRTPQQIAAEILKDIKKLNKN